MSSGFVFSQRSKDNLEDVHPDLIAVMTRALELSRFDFIIIEGMRSLVDQRKYFDTGKSKTMNSKHLLQRDGFSHAVDIAVLVNGKVNWDLKNYAVVNEAVQQAAAEKGVKITWGGSWKTFVDGPHFQLEL